MAAMKHAVISTVLLAGGLTSAIMVSVYLHLSDVPSTVQLDAMAGDAQVTLSWSLAQVAEGVVDDWQVQIENGCGEQYGAEWLAIDPTVCEETGTTTYVVEPLKNGWSCAFRVRARRGGAVGRPSNRATATPREERRTTSDRDQQDDRGRHFCAEQRDLGVVHFGLDSAEIDCGGGEVREIVGKLQHDGARGVVLVEGYATAKGGVLHNLDLSERRAVAVIDCVQDALPDSAGRLAFREVARGESYVAVPNGENRRIAAAVLCRNPEPASGAG